MSMAELGDQLDIHCGGIDHINVHHTNEIAQSEAATGKPFFNVWMHGAFLNIKGGKKMAKSENNFLTLDNAFIKKDIDPLVYRFAALQTHYRKPMEYSEESIKNAEKGLEHLYNQVRSLGVDKSKIKDQESKCNEKFKINFVKAINDDLNMPKTLAVVQEVLKSKINDEEKYATMLDFDRVLGLNLNNVDDVEISKDVQDLINRREKAREEKNWDESDRLRDEIEKLGYILKDKKDGVEIIKK